MGEITGVTVDPAGNLYFVDTNNYMVMKVTVDGNLYIVDYAGNRVRKVSPAGVITTFAGNGEATGAGDGGQASRASLILPIDAAFDASGNLWILQSGKLSAVSPAGIISGAEI